MQKRQTAILELEDGTKYEGISFGMQHACGGEVVFNTGMVGYPEALTDPSYRGQILVLTYPLIGNYGIPDNTQAENVSTHFESDKIQVSGLVITNYSGEKFHWSAAKTLGQWLRENNIPAIYDVDTRALTKKLRESGSQLGQIYFTDQDKLTVEDPNLRNLVSEVSLQKPIEFQRGKKRIVIVDCGVKNNIIRSFLQRDISVIRVPWDYDFTKIKADGIIISNGPGDPKLCRETIKNVRESFKKTTPILGICLGSQIMGLAAGADTYKLKYGHRGHNQPCSETGTRRCYITSQNHGYAIDTKTLPLDWREWFYNDNDGTNEGLLHISKPFFGAQFHPEASPGPDDTDFLFDMFVRAMG
jgi:carbamoyl-phosphate synthase small subunit